MAHDLMTISWDNWRHKIYHGCPARIFSFDARGSDWPYCHCSRRPPVPMDFIRGAFGPRDKEGKPHTYDVCSYFYCPEIHPNTKDQINYE